MQVDKSFDLLVNKELLAKIASGDEKAFETLFKQYQTMVYDFSLRLTRSRDHAEEIVQKIFIKIWISRASLDKIENFGAYLNRSTRNESYSVLRTIAAKNLREVELTDQEILSSSDSSARLSYQESSAMLKAAVDNLPPQRKLVYQLCHEQGMKYEEVASRLQLSPGTVQKHMKLALKSIRENFKQMDAVLLVILLMR